ncbi:MAG TPA: hypothetical protein VN736_25935 [Candidatus Limnocylindrales bacterium]|nr:hypothetical protein [Candidatus Limnocylindrales bacterium]
MKRKQQPEALTLEQYNTALQDFSDQRHALNDRYQATRRLGEVEVCKAVFDLWREVVASEHHFITTHPAPVSV